MVKNSLLIEWFVIQAMTWIANLKFVSSRGGLVVEQWSHNRLLSATVDQIPLGAMIYILNKEEYKVYRRVL